MQRDFRILKIGLKRERDDLYMRINERVDEMLKNGLEDEARSLLHLRNLNPLKSVGYSEFFDFIEARSPGKKAVVLIKGTAGGMLKDK